MPAGIPLGPYVLVRRLATGGMAEIFLARREGPEGFARELVVKRILPHLSQDPAFTGMFLEEARIAARLTHPNVVQVYDFGEVEGSYYLAMELVRGVDLNVLIERAARGAHLARRGGALPPHHAAKILSLVCEGLAHAHELTIGGKEVGLVHRDVSPSNVLISFDGAVKVADFGIAKADTGRQRDDTRIGVVKGKYAYMSPEQARGDYLDARSDLFNVGVLLFEAITGDTIFPHGDYRASKLFAAAGRIPDPERIDQMPAMLARVTKRALAPEREQRYPDALSLRADLETFLRACPDTSDQVELGRYVRELFPDAIEEDRRAPRAAGTVPATSIVTPEDGPTVIDPEGPTLPAGPAAMRDPSEITPPIDLGPPPVRSAEPRRARGTRPVLIVGAAGLLAALSGMILFLAVGGAEDPPRVTELPPRPEEMREQVAPAAPEPGEIRVTSEPLGLPLFVDGEERGETPVVLTLSSGEEHSLELRSDGGVAAREEVTLSPGEARELTLTSAVPRQATLRVVTVPSGAEVRVSGEPRGLTPLAVDVPPGEYEVEVAAEGYVSQTSPAVLRGPDETATLSFVLQEVEVEQSRAPRRRSRSAHRARRARPNGTLVIATTPWSDVYLGTRHLGTTPLSNVSLPAGRHTLTLRSPGREPRRRTVTIRPGEETRVRLAL